MDDTTIVNMVLSAIGTRSTVSSLLEASAEAEQTNLIYAQTRNELLRKVPWDWARYQTALAVQMAALGTPENPLGTLLPIPPMPWRYAYQYPADCSRARFILPIQNINTIPGIPLTTATLTPPTVVSRGPWVEFKVAGAYLGQPPQPAKIILCNLPQAQLVYTARITVPDIWDELFVCALIGRLAAKLVVPLSGDKTLAKIAIEKGVAAEDDAATANGKEDVTIADVMPDWLAIRGVADDLAGLQGADSLYGSSLLGFGE